MRNGGSAQEKTGSGKKWDRIWVNVHLATMDGQTPYGIVEDGALAVKDGRIAFVGRRTDLPAQPDQVADRVEDGDGNWMTPGLIDCHTHIVYAGDRSDEFELRLNGISYEEIARRGGGIKSTVAATRAASENQLFAESLPRMQGLIAEGVTTVEIKSGYGLDLATETKMLRVARRLGQHCGIRVKTTFLGAHAVPVEYNGRSEAYIDYLCNGMLPAIAGEGLADAVDVFCETIGFSLHQTERMFKAAKQHGLPVKLHAEQLSNQHSAKLAARYGALSADHLEHLDEDGVIAMAAAGTVATLLPGAYYFLRDTQPPPIDLLRRHRVPMALASDSNPGSAPTGSLLLMLNMACTLFGLTPAEALHGVTDVAARALGLSSEIGRLEVGRWADCALWNIRTPAELSYRFGHNPCRRVLVAGKSIGN